MQQFDQLFSDLDTDNDNMLIASDAQKVLEQLEISYYFGMLLKIFNINDPQEKKISREELRKYCSYSLKGLGFLAEFDAEFEGVCIEFREKLESIEEEKKHRKAMKKLEEGNPSDEGEGEKAEAGAGAGAAPQPPSQQLFRQQNIKIDFQVGPNIQHTNRFSFQAIKQKTPSQKSPFLHIIFTPKQNKSQQLVQQLKQITSSIKQILNSKVEEYDFLTNSINVEVYQEEDKVILGFTTECEELNESLKSFVELPDKFFGQVETEGRLKLFLGTSWNYEDIFGQQNTSSFIDSIFKFFTFRVDFKGSSELFQLFQNISLAVNLFRQVKAYSHSFEQFIQTLLLGITVSTVEDLDIELKFNSLENWKSRMEEYQQRPVKGVNKINSIILEDCSEGLRSIKDDPYLSWISKLLSCVFEKSEIDIGVLAEIGKLRVEANLVTENLGYLYEKIKERVAGSD